MATHLSRKQKANRRRNVRRWQKRQETRRPIEHRPPFIRERECHPDDVDDLSRTVRELTVMIRQTKDHILHGDGWRDWRRRRALEAALNQRGKALDALRAARAAAWQELCEVLGLAPTEGDAS